MVSRRMAKETGAYAAAVKCYKLSRCGNRYRCLDLGVKPPRKCPCGLSSYPPPKQTGGTRGSPHG